MPKFSTSTSHSKQIPKPALAKPLLKSSVILILIIFLTYYGKFAPKEREAVRNHGLLSWNFPSKNGIASLVVLPDDNIDENLTKTGHRLWINPPRHPALIEKEAAFFRGPRMTVLADSLRVESIIEIANSIDSGGTLYLIGKQFPSLITFSEQFNHLQIHFDTLSPYMDLPVGIDVSAQLESQENGLWNLTIKTPKYRLQYTNQTGPTSKFLVKKQSIITFNNALPQKNITAICPILQCPLSLFTDFDSDNKDPNSINIFETNYGVLFFEDLMKDQLDLKKIPFIHWDRELQ